MQALVFLGIFISIIGGIGLLIAAFRVSALWFLLCFFISPVALVFVVLHWDEAKNPFLLQLVGFGLIFAGAAGS